MSTKPGATTWPPASMVRSTGRLAQRDDAAVPDPDVAAPPLGAGAVDEGAARDLEVVGHGVHSTLMPV
jgi:hypothetical protein